jgi:uncharacterized protein (DUF2336 family)
MQDCLIMALTTMDVKKLTHEPSAEIRGMLAAKIAVDFSSSHFTEVESAIAADIFRILLKDTDKVVRKNLAQHLSSCDNAPHDIILKLAQDEADIASSVLEHSTVLTDDDLMEIVKSTKEVLKLCAVARRSKVSEPVSDILLGTWNEEVLHDLFQNKGAALSEKSLMQTWNVVSSSRSLLETLVHRGDLPLTVAEKIYVVVTDELKGQLVKKYKFASPQAQKLSSDAREWEMLGIVPANGSISPQNDEQVEDLIDQLYMGGRLTHSFLIRALCVGSLSVFEAGLARLAGVPRVNARILLMDGGALGFQGIYKEAAMPEGFAEAVNTLLRISLEETEYGRTKESDFRKRVIDRVYSEGYHNSIDNMGYMLSIIGGKLAPANAH